MRDPNWAPRRHETLKYAFYASFILLVALASGAYGVAAGVYRLWPYTQIRLLKDEVQFYWSDLNGGMDRVLLPARGTTRDDHQPLTGDISFGASTPVIAIDPSVQGDTIVVGSFDFDTGFEHAALLIDRQGAVKHVWHLHEKEIDHVARREARFKIPHGFSALTDGSVVFAFDGGVSLQRFDACSRSIWSHTDHYHHSVKLDEAQEHVWSLLNYDPSDEDRQDQALRDGIVKVRISDGEIVNSFTTRDIIDANPRLDVFGARQLEERFGGYRWEADALHSNDADPLPESMASAFPEFEAGDLLISHRSINMVTVVDPESHEVKWFTTGHMRRQHDPDWQPDGTISIYDNNMHRGASHIIRIDPDRPHEVETIVDGTESGFYSWQQGKHQITEAGTVLVSSPQQGRVLEYDAAGNVVFEFINAYDGGDEHRLFVTQAIRIPETYFEDGAFGDCGPLASL